MKKKLLKRIMSLSLISLMLLVPQQANASHMQDPLDYQRGLDLLLQKELEKANMQLNIHETYKLDDEVSINIANIRNVTDYNSDLMFEKEDCGLQGHIQIAYDINYKFGEPCGCGIVPVGIKSNGEKVKLKEDEYYKFRNIFEKDTSKSEHTTRWTRVYQIPKDVKSISIKALPIKGGYEYSAGVNNDNFWNIKIKDITRDGWV